MLEVRTVESSPFPSEFGALSDVMLVEAMQSGCLEALAELYQRYSGAVCRLASLSVGSQLAADVVVAVFVDLWRAEYARDLQSQLEAPLIYWLLDCATRRSANLDPGANVGSTADAVEELDPLARGALVLLASGESCERAAAALDESPSAVAAAARRALDQLGRSQARQAPKRKTMQPDVG